MKDIYKTKKQLIKELEDVRCMLSHKATEDLKADVAEKEADQHRGVAETRCGEETLLLIRKAIDNTTDAIALSDSQGRHIYQNEAFTNLFEYTAEELEAAGGGQATFAVDSIARDVFGAIMSGRSWSGEVEMKAKSGRIFDMFLRADAIKDDAGETVGLVGVFTDITERKLIEYQLRKKNDELKLILDYIPAYVFYKDKDGKLLNINKTAADLAYVPREKLLNKTVFDLVPETADRYNRDDMEVITSGQPKTNIEEPLKLPDGVRWLRTDKLPIKDDDGNTVGLLGFSVDITERKAAEEALRESETKYRYLAEKMTDIVWTLDMDLNSTYVSPSITRILGYTPEERLVQPVKDQLTPESYERVVKTLAVDLERDGREGVDPDRSVVIEVEYYRKDGSTVLMENVVSAIRDEKGKPVMLHGVSRDIVERKRAEGALQESEQKLRWMFESIKEGIFIVGTDGRVLEANAGVEKITGYSREQLLGQSGLDYMFPGFKGDAMGMMEKMIARGGTHREVIVPMKTAAGDAIEVEATSSTLRDSSGNPIGLIGIFRNVSERKCMENALRNSEEKLRLTFASMADGIVVTNVEGKITDINEAQLRMFGYKEKSELIGKGGFDFLAERERGRALADMFKVYEEGFNTGSTYTVVDRNGREFECELSTALLHDAAGKPSGTVTVMRDVTDRRRMEQKLRESEERYRLLAENATDAIWTIDMNLKYTFVSPAILRVVKGYALEELTQMTIQELLAPESFSTATKLIEEELALEDIRESDPYRSRTAELELRNKDGSTVWTEIQASFTRDSGGRVVGVQGSTRDITERRKAEQLIRESEERYRLLAENVSDLIWTMDMNFKYKYMSPSVLNLRGYTAEEAMNMSLEETLSPASMEVVKQVISEEMEVDHSDQYASRTVELELKCKDGSTVWTEIRLSWLHDANGNRIGFMGVTRDITERRKVAEALRETSEKLRVVFDSIGEAVTVVGMNGDILDANREALRLHGFNRKEEIIGRKSSELVAVVDRDRAVKDAVRVLKTSIPSGRSEYKLIDMVGKEFYGEFNIAVMRDERGKPAGFIGIARDISERKRMEEALLRINKAVESSSDAIAISDSSGHHFYHNRAFTELFEYTTEELEAAGGGPAAYASEDIAHEVFKKIISGGSWSGEVEMMSKGGRVFTVLLRADAIKDEEGKVIGLIGVHTDIAERKRMEEALRSSEEKLRVMFDSMMDGVVVSDPDINIVDVNNAVLEMLGVSAKEDLIGRNAMDVIRFKEQEAAMSNLARMFAEQRPQERVEYSIVLPDGREMDVEASTAMMHNNAGSIIGFVNVIRDVSERKQWEDALRKSEEKYRSLVEREKDVIVSVDALGFVTSINAAVKMWGYTTDEVMKMNFFDLIAPGWRDVTATELQARLLEKGEYIGETVVVRKDGEEWPIEYSAVVVYDEQGQYAGAQAIVRDISERKRAEEAAKARERYFRAITDLSSGAALIVGPDGTIVDVTGGLERISGYKREITIGHSAIEFIHPEELEKAGEVFNEALRNPGKTVAFEVRLKNAQGEWQWTECMITNLLDHPDVRGIVNHMVDITERKKAEEEIRRHAERVEALYGVAQVISQSSSLDTMLREALAKVCDVMETEAGTIFMLDMEENALKLKACKGVSKDIMQQFSTLALTEQGFERIMRLQGPVTEIDETYIVADVEKSKSVTAELGRKAIAATPLFRGGDLQGLIVVFSTEERTFSGGELDLFKAIANEISLGINNMMLLEKTRELSVTDELTGLYNRRYFFEMLDVEMNRAGRTKRPFSLAMIDLDGFKEYNDKYGHSNGDAVLEAFSQVLRSSIRKSDLAFRYGGDEFALVLPEADAERANKIVQRMRAKWQKASVSQSRIFGGHVGFSSGIAEYPHNAESSDGLIFLADAALYQAKKKGHEDKIVSELRTLSTDIMDVATRDQVYALAATVDARDPYTYGHSQRVADTAVRIGKAVGMSAEDLEKLHAAALMHDIGKVGVPDAILTKMGKPTPEEWDVIKKHCAEGARILGYVKELAALVPIVLHHHEWYDGSGYPAGLGGLEIPPGARITAVADAYDTMVTKRPYRDAITPNAACEELKRCVGTQFDPVIVNVWCKLVEKEEK